MGILSANRIFIAAGLVLALTREGHVGVASLNQLKLGELAGRANIIVTATPMNPFEKKEAITFADSAGRIPPLDCDTYRFKRGDVLKNTTDLELPDTLVVFDYYTESHSRGHVFSHTTGEVESPITLYYESPIKADKLAKEKSVLLFLTQVHDNPIVSPRTRLEFTATQSYEKASKVKAVTKLVANPVFPPGMKPQNPFPVHPK